MWEDDLLKPAAVQYGDWKGTVAGDDVDMRDVCEFLGIDRDKYRVLALDVSIYGGNQHLVAYGVPADQGYVELEATTDRGEPIRCQVLAEIEFDPANNFDTNPPPPLSLPVVSPTEFLGPRLQAAADPPRHTQPSPRLAVDR
jgi:hypothetical protein